MPVSPPLLRWYQTDVKQRLYDAWSSLGSSSAVMAVLATGSGKTILVGSVVAEHQGGVCCIAHRQELVSQISMALARFGVRHRIIAPDKVVRAICAQHVEELGENYVWSTSPVGVAGVDTLNKRGLSEHARWAAQVTMWVTDECFPAGTMIDGRPIEEIQIGDFVQAFNEKTGQLEPRRVVRLFKNQAPRQMVRFATTHHVVDCTLGHPVFTRRGWVDAAELAVTDEVLIDELHAMRGRNPEPFRVSEGAGKELRAGLLRQDLLQQVQVPTILGNDGGHESQICVGTDDQPQPHAQGRISGEDAENAASNWARPEAARREWPASDRRGSGVAPTVFGPRVSTSDGSSDGLQKRGERLAVSVQAGHWEQETETRDRSGRSKSPVLGAPSAGREERHVLSWARVDSVEIYERGDSRFPRNRRDDGFVYNFEVEGLHTYVANGVVVHNCHHLAGQGDQANKWAKAAAMFPNAKGLGVTATPCRSDGKGLGRHADGVFDEMVVGPTMRDLIDQGFLTDYRIVVAETHIDLSGVNVNKDGDWTLDRGKGKDAVRQSPLVGDVVKEYLARARGMLGVCFTSDVDTAGDIAQRFRENGVTAEMLSGTTPDDKRREVMRKFKRREILVIVNCDLLGEGVDVPAIEVVMMARPTMSFALFAQQFGRALRLMVDSKLLRDWDSYSVEQRKAIVAAGAKPKALLIDHVGNVLRHGLPDARNDWTLDRRDKRASKPNDAIQLTACLNPVCMAPYERAKPCCPFCGWKPEPRVGARSPVEAVDGNMFELPPEALAALRGAVATNLKSNDQIRRELLAQGLPSKWIMGQVKHHDAKLQAAEDLRDAMEWWAGERRAEGQSDAEVMKRFYLTFGVDWLTARAGDRAAMAGLTERIDEKLTPASSALRVRATG